MYNYKLVCKMKFEIGDDMATCMNIVYDSK